MATYSEIDIQYMRSAINMARRGIGRTAENPSVGCVIVKNGSVVARARTADGGRPHAEALAIQDAGEQARGATLYVTLEPCAHRGKTPPCVDAVIASGVKRVVIGMVDPDPRTGGSSIQKLKDAGVDVVCDVLKNECAETVRGFVSRVVKKRPFVTLKCACTLDGKIALASGESKWVTGSLSRQSVHALRARHDAILIGVETALHDDPILNARVDGVEHSITRIVLDRHLRLGKDSQLMQTAIDYPLMIFHEDGDVGEIVDEPVDIRKVDCTDMVSVLESVAKNGINHLLVEGGARVHASFLRAGCFDELHIYRAPTFLGEGAKSVVSNLNIDTLMQRLDVKRVAVQFMDDDTLEIYKKKD